MTKKIILKDPKNVVSLSKKTIDFNSLIFEAHKYTDITKSPTRYMVKGKPYNNYIDYKEYKRNFFFASYEELLKKLEKAGLSSRIKERMFKESRKIEIAPIEEVLGYYNFIEKKIVLFAKGINWYAQRFLVSENALFNVVLIHEIGHWITNALKHQSSVEWDTQIDILELRHLDKLDINQFLEEPNK